MQAAATQFFRFENLLMKPLLTQSHEEQLVNAHEPALDSPWRPLMG
jgi:hypothetical protein